MKIAVISIGTGAYSKYLTSLSISINKYFLKSHQVTLLTFSDRDIDGLTVFRIECLPVPLPMILKFHYINQLLLANYDLVYMIDSDCIIVSPIEDEVIPSHGQLVAVEHPWQKFNSLLYETRPESKACVTDSKGMHYFQSCFFGGYLNDFCKMTQELESHTNIDLINKIITPWYDESYLNRYLIDHPPKHLPCGYAYPAPDIWNQTFNSEIKIIHFNNNSVK